MNIQKVLEIISKGTYGVYAVRCGYNGAAIGEHLSNSHEWFQDADNIPGYWDMTEEEQDAIYKDGLYDGGELDGVSCVIVTEDNAEKVINAVIKKYSDSGEIVLVAGEYYTEGNDVDEIILEDAIRLL